MAVNSATHLNVFFFTKVAVKANTEQFLSHDALSFLYVRPSICYTCKLCLNLLTDHQVLYARLYKICILKCLKWPFFITTTLLGEIFFGSWHLQPLYYKNKCKWVAEFTATLVNFLPYWVAIFSVVLASCSVKTGVYYLCCFFQISFWCDR